MEQVWRLAFWHGEDRIPLAAYAILIRILPVSMKRLAIPAWSLAGLAAVPPFIWWMGWSPGFATSDTVDQWSQLTTERYLNHHPAIHTLFMDLASVDGVRPDLVTLLQVVAFGILMIYGAKWLVAAGTPTWLSIGAAWLLGLSPAVASTTVALWKDVPFGLFFAWAWIELLALAVDKSRVSRWGPSLRIGLALAGVALFRANGLLTVVPMLIVLLWIYRRELSFALRVGFTAGVTWLLVSIPIYGLLDVEGSPIEPATVFLPEVAASYAAESDLFTPEEVGLLEAVAPIEVWLNNYSCYDSTPLVFSPEFDASVVTENPDPYRRLELRVLIRDPGSVIEHRLCAANFLYSPPQPPNAYFHRPEYEIPQNDVGLIRDPVSREAFELTDAVWRWAEPDSRLWLTWRPAVVVLPALAALILLTISGETRLMVPGSLFLIHLANVAATSPAQEFRYAYPLYLVGVMTIVLAWPAVVKLRRTSTG